MASTKRAATAPPHELNATAASILGFLEHEPKTGWDLAVEIEDVIGDFWSVTRSQVYRELKVLAAEGLVASLETGPRDRQPYRVTEAGRRAFRAWIGRKPGLPNMRLPLVLQVFFGDAVPPADLARSLEELGAYHAQRLAVYRGFEARVPKSSWPYEALRLGIMFQQTMVDWIASVQRHRPRPKPGKSPRVGKPARKSDRPQ
ncbi:MAG TPA: PadR family transcriptional regulator [Polyangiaceae bacterium]|jgi:DNA-binding PadR family transcriptional regulator